VVLVLLAVVCAVATRATAWQIAQSLEISVVHVDPGLVGYLTPTVFAGFAFAVGRRMLNEAWTGRPALLFYAWLLGFTAANVVNRCNPGWCATVGFPLVWYSWSDALVTFGNERFDYWLDVLGKVFGPVVNLLTFVVVASLLTRGRVQPAKPATK
jgi:hypothetical protein